MAVCTLLTQENASLIIEHNLPDKDVFNIRSITVTEAIDEPFEIIAHVVSEKPDIDFKDMIGKPVTFTMRIEDEDRVFHGIVAHFMQFATPDPNANDVTWYEIKAYPKMWFLKLSSDCRIFQDETPKEIINTVLNEHGVDEVAFKLTKCGQLKREYCVQYNETNFDFISRIMEEEGMYYFFDHGPDGHVLVIADDLSAHPLCKGAEVLEYEPARPQSPMFNVITKCDPKQKVVSLAHAMSDYNMTIASTQLFAMMSSGGNGITAGSRDSELNTQKTKEYGEKVGENYEYPGQLDHEDIPTKDRLEHLTRLRIEEMDSMQTAIVGESTSPYLSTGGKFELVKHNREDINGKYILKKITHEIISASEDISEQRGADPNDTYLYSNSFEAYVEGQPYRPVRKTRRPKIESIQSAMVTGPEGEEIWTDIYGRIKVQFKWDRVWPNNDTSSCWIRVLQGWGGNNWGVLFTPRIGMEVMVSFLDGDPDRPVVTGCLYNSDHMPPYLPERITGEMTPTKSTIKSNSSKGGGGFNEFRYEDKKGDEQVYFRAEKDYDRYIIENETKHIEKGSSWLTVDQGNRDVALLGGGDAVPKTTPAGQAHPSGQGDDNLELTTGRRNASFLSQSGAVHDSTRIIEGDTWYQNDLGNYLDIQKQGNYSKTIVQGNHDSVIETGNKSWHIDTGNKSTVIKTGDRRAEIKTGNDITHIETGDQYTHIKTGDKKILIDLGNIGIKLDKGNHVTKQLDGNFKVDIDKGDDIVIIQVGNQTLTLAAGDNLEDVTGNYNGTYTKKYTLTVTEDISVTSSANISITAADNITVKAGGNIEMTAGGRFAMKSGGDMSAETGANLDVKSAANSTYKSGSGTSIKAGAALNTKSGAGTSITAGAKFSTTSGASTSMKSGASFEVNSGAALTMSIGGSMTVTAGATTFTVSSFAVIT